jgi:hypothetical protein
MVMQITTLLAWIAGPLALLAMIDDWFLRPGRRLASLPDPPLMRAVYMLLPVAVVGSIVRLLVSEQLDFSLVLVLVLAAAALVRVLDGLLLAPRRARAAARAPASCRSPRWCWCCARSSSSRSASRPTP